MSPSQPARLYKPKIDPGLASLGERIGVGMKKPLILDDELAGAQMPPHVGIGDIASREHEQPDRKDDHEQAAR
jgi:hypothetical protein